MIINFYKVTTLHVQHPDLLIGLEFARAFSTRTDWLKNCHMTNFQADIQHSSESRDNRKYDTSQNAQLHIEIYHKSRAPTC